MRDESDDLGQTEIIRRLAALLLQVGNLPHSEDPCDDDWRQGFIAGCCAATAVAGGAGAAGALPLNELARLGLDLARTIDWSTP